MKSTILCAVVGAAILCGAAPAFAQPAQPARSPPPCTTPSQCLVAGGTAPIKRDEAVASNDVPEPGTLALMGIGAIGVGYISRRYGARKA